jgi:hypothetical protein
VRNFDWLSFTPLLVAFSGPSGSLILWFDLFPFSISSEVRSILAS